MLGVVDVDSKEGSDFGSETVCKVASDFSSEVVSNVGVVCGGVGSLLISRAIEAACISLRVAISACCACIILHISSIVKLGVVAGIVSVGGVSEASTVSSEENSE